MTAKLNIYPKTLLISQRKVSGCCDQSREAVEVRVDGEGFDQVRVGVQHDGQAHVDAGLSFRLICVYVP